MLLSGIDFLLNVQFAGFREQFHPLFDICIHLPNPFFIACNNRPTSHDGWYSITSLYTNMRFLFGYFNMVAERSVILRLPKMSFLKGTRKKLVYNIYRQEKLVLPPGCFNDLPVLCNISVTF